MQISTQVQNQIKAYKDAGAIQKIQSASASHLGADSHEKPYHFSEDQKKSFSKILKEKMNQSK